MTIQPQGKKILVSPIEKGNFKTESDIELISNELGYAKVVEFSSEFDGIYKKGDIVTYPSSAGIFEMYNGERCLWLNGEGNPNGDVWGIVTFESK